MMRKNLRKLQIGCLATGILVSLGSGAVTEDLRKSAVRIAGEAFVGNGAYKIVKVLADDFGSRLTGTAAAHEAAAYCLDHFKASGLTNAHFEDFEVVGWEPGEASAEALAPRNKRLRIDSLGLSVNTSPQGLVARIVDVGHGTKDDFEKKKSVLKGQIALAGLNDPSDSTTATKEWQKVLYAAQNGATACLIIARTKGGLTRTRASNYGDYSPIPAASIAYEDGTWMRRALEDGKDVRMKLTIQNEILPTAKAENVIAEIRGAEKPGEIVILGAHLDSWFLGPGAADNALGCGIALETARILNGLGARPKRTIRFVLFAGEEEGLLGSFEYARRHEAELAEVVLMVNLDITGIMYPGFLNPYGGCQFKNSLDDLVGLLRGLGVTQVSIRAPYDSDDFNFIAKGVPALGLQGRGVSDWAWGHSYADTFDKIEIDKLNMTLAAVGIIVDYAANHEEPLAAHLSRDEVIRYFREKNLEKNLKEEKTWQKLGFPDK
jgi:Zn-dependent M28 family amino/carboxypeptidase